MTILFHDIVFGPVKSRRFGVSLGMNLLPIDSKFCSFNCVYCECGWTENKKSAITFHRRDEIKTSLEERLIQLKKDHVTPNNITFAGNGEPTLHPEFSGIVDDTILLRDKYFPEAQITVLSNATLLDKDEVYKALLKVDNNVLKLDAGTEAVYRAINQPNDSNITLEKIIKRLMRFKGNMIIQSLFVKGYYKGVLVDNSSENEIEEWLKHLKSLHPKLVMIYSFERATADPDLHKVPRKRLEEIADKVRQIGLTAEVYV